MYTFYTYCILTTKKFTLFTNHWTLYEVKYFEYNEILQNNINTQLQYDKEYDKEFLSRSIILEYRTSICVSTD